MLNKSPIPLALSGAGSSISRGTIVFSNSNGVSFGMNGSTITASAAGGGGSINLSAGTTSNNLTNFVLSNANGVSFGLNGSTVTGSVATSLSNIRISAGTTSNLLSAVTFSNANGVSFGLNASVVTGSVATSLTNMNVSAGTTSNNLSNVVFSNSNGVSFGLNGSTVTGSVATSLTNINLSAGTASNNLSAFVFSNSNNVSFGLNGSTVTATATIATSLSNINVSAGTTSNNLSNVVFSNANGVSFGLNGSTVTGSVATSLTNINVSAGTTSNNLSAIVFSNAGNVSFGLNGSTVTATATNAQSNQSVGLYAVGNTTQNSSTTLDARTISYNAIGAATMGFSNGSVQVSIPQTSSLSATGIVSISTNGSTISIGARADRTISFFEVPPIGDSSAFSFGNSSLYLLPFHIPNTASFCRLGDIISLSALNTSAYSTSTGLAAAETFSNQLAWGVTRSYALYSQGTGASSVRIESFYSSTWRMGATGGYTLSNGLASQTVNNAISYDVISQIGTNGAYTLTTVSTNFSTSGAGTSVGNAFSSIITGLKNIYMGFATTLQPGNYWLGFVQSSASASTGSVNSTLMSMSGIPFTTQTSAFWLLGRTNTSNSNQPLGGGVYSAATGAIPSVISFSEINNANFSNMRNHVVMENLAL